MKVLTIDIGGTNVKILASGQNDTTPRKFPSGPELTPGRMASQVKKLAEGWQYDVVSIGYPGPVYSGRPAADPRNLGKGWMRFNFAGAFKRPVKIINDAAMQALGSYKGGLLLFLGLGTGFGSAVVVQGSVVPLELGHLPYRGGTYESYLGARALKRLGKKKWQRQVERAVAALTSAIHPDDVVLGGGNAKKLKALPPGSRAGHNAFAFLGGFRLWEELKTPAKSKRTQVAGGRKILEPTHSRARAA
jgi:polyphosphate glucokinase